MDVGFTEEGFRSDDFVDYALSACELNYGEKC